MSLSDNALAALDEINPARSPILTVATTAIVVLFFMCPTASDPHLIASPIWFGLTVPLATLLVVAVVLCSRTDGNDEDINSNLSDDPSERRQQRVERTTMQWKRRQETGNFCRAVGAALPLVTLAGTTIAIDVSDDLDADLFWLPYASCFVQTAIFMAAMFQGRLPRIRHASLVQLALLSSCFLIAGAGAVCFLLHQNDETYEISREPASYTLYSDGTMTSFLNDEIQCEVILENGHATVDHRSDAATKSDDAFFLARYDEITGRRTTTIERATLLVGLFYLLWAVGILCWISQWILGKLDDRRNEGTLGRNTNGPTRSATLITTS